MQDAGKVEAAQHASHLFPGEDVAGDEAAQRAPKPLLLAGNDRGVRDRQSERVAEQCGYREPVGDAADEASLGGRCQQVGAPAGRDRPHRDQDERGHQHQERQGERLVSPE